MIIPPPFFGDDDDDGVIPINVEAMDRTRYESIRIFLNVKPWLCSLCSVTNFGRNERCANFRCRSPRPADFKLETKE